MKICDVHCSEAGNNESNHAVFHLSAGFPDILYVPFKKQSYKYDFGGRGIHRADKCVPSLTV